MRNCEYCGTTLPADAAPRKRFCSAECERRSYYEGRRDKDHAREEAEEGIPLREFSCEQCGHWVRVMSKSDRRFRFCSAKCEKEFWKRNKPKAASGADQPVHVFDENGDDYFFGYKSAINEEEPVPHLVVTGIFANTEDLKDGNGEMQVIELQVKE